MDMQIEPGGDAFGKGVGRSPSPRRRNRSTTIQLTLWVAGLLFLYSRLCSICSHVSVVFLLSRRGIMRASGDGWPRASYCIGALWLIELAKWKMKCRRGRSVRRAVSVRLWGKWRWTRSIDSQTFPCSWRSASEPSNPLPHHPHPSTPRRRRT